MRHCFITPIPEIELATKLLDAAADALLLGDKLLAARLIVDSDKSAISEYTRRIVGKLSMEVHRQVTLPKSLPKDERVTTRMPTPTIAVQVFERDSWHCRFCGVRVVSRPARNLLVKLFPDETHWVTDEYQRHSALYATAASLDHVVPHSRGGENEIHNFVTVCFCCQFGRGQFTLDEVELSDPRDRKPVRSRWDGLTRIMAIQTSPL
jgi:5-methylcytosine-specific restriction endonuclease McrA